MALVKPPPPTCSPPSFPVPRAADYVRTVKLGGSRPRRKGADELKVRSSPGQTNRAWRAGLEAAGLSGLVPQMIAPATGAPSPVISN